MINAIVKTTISTIKFIDNANKIIAITRIIHIQKSRETIDKVWL